MNSIFLSKKDNKILLLVKILLGLCLATPLLAWSGVIFPYTVPKVFAFRVLVEIAAVLYLYLALKYPAYFCTGKICHPELVSGSQNIKSRNKFGMTIGVTVLVFLAVNFLSALFGADFYSSFWGNLERGGGVFSFLHFAAFFFMLVSVFRIDSSSPLCKKGVGEDFCHRELTSVIPAPQYAGGIQAHGSRIWPARLASWITSVAGAGDFGHQLIIVSVLTSTLISLLAIGQHFFSLGNLLPQSDRVYSLIGNAGVFGSYLIFNIFLSGYLAILSFKKSNFCHWDLGFYWKFVISHLNFLGYCLSLFVCCFALLFSGTRGAWLGLLAGIIVFLLLSFFSPPFLKGGEACPPMPTTSGVGRRGGFKGFKKLSLFFLIAIIVAIGLLFPFRNSSFVQNNPTLSRLTSISLSDTTAQNRLILWQSAWQAWQEKPLLGWGPENFEIANNKYFDPRLAPFEAWYDRAHNFIFDYGVTIGWLGLLSYLAIFFVAGWTLIKSFLGRHPERSEGSTDSSLAGWRTQNDKQHFPIIFLSLLAAYLIQNFFIFDSFVSYLMLFFVLAIVSSMGHPEHLRFAQHKLREGSSIDSSSRHSGTRNDKKGSSHPERSEESSSLYKKLILLFAIGYSLLVIYSFNLKPFLAANYANQILSLPAAQVAQAAPLFKDALALNSFASPEITYQVVLDYIEKIGQNPALAQNEEFYNVASEELSKIIERSPSQSRNYVALSWLNLYFSGQEKARIEQSWPLAQKVRELSPNKKDAYLLLVASYSLSNQPQKALEVVDQALVVDAKMGEEVKAYLERLK